MLFHIRKILIVFQRVILYNKHTCREVSPGLDAPRVAGSFPNSPCSGNFQPPEETGNNTSVQTGNNTSFIKYSTRALARTQPANRRLQH